MLIFFQKLAVVFVKKRKYFLQIFWRKYLKNLDLAVISIRGLMIDI
jgi:hypothetical protein